MHFYQRGRALIAVFRLELRESIENKRASGDYQLRLIGCSLFPSVPQWLRLSREDPWLPSRLVPLTLSSGESRGSLGF